jgi:hypothetical protein
MGEEDFQREIGELFQKAQKTTGVHSSAISRFCQLYKKDPETFKEDILQVINKLMAAPKEDKSIDRTIDFLKKAVAAADQSLTAEEDENPNDDNSNDKKNKKKPKGKGKTNKQMKKTVNFEDEKLSVFIMNYLLSKTEAKDRKVRLRVVTIISQIFSHLEDVE